MKTNFITDKLNKIIQEEIISKNIPKPKNLIKIKNTTYINVGMSLTRNSVSWFKTQAAEHHVPYQKMIQVVLEKYIEHYDKQA